MKKVKISLLNTGGKLTEGVAKTLKCNGDDNTEDVLKGKGWNPEQGPCVALIGDCIEGKVKGMKIKTFGDKITIEWELENLWDDIPKVSII